MTYAPRTDTGVHICPDYARDIAFQKIKNGVEGTMLAANALSV